MLGLLLAVLASACSAPEPDPEWEPGEGFRSIGLRPMGGPTGFSAVAGTGVDFVGVLSDSAFIGNRHRVNGAGVAVGDVDGDGMPDVFLAGLEAPSRLYRNLGGFRFEDVTERAGVSLKDRYNTGAMFLDVEGDGDQDLVVTTLDGPSMLFLNDGNGRFTEDRSWLGRLAGPRGGTTLTAADIDGDGDLDIYVTNYKRRTVKDLYHPARITFEETVQRTGSDFRVVPPFDEHYRVKVQGNRVMRYEYAEPDMLLVNEGNGTFRDATPTAFPGGADMAEDWGLAAQFRDLDGDGRPDLYVANDFESPDHVWMNRGDGTFRPALPTALRHTAQSSMAVDGSDVDRDGDVDLFVTEMLSRTHERRLRQVGNPPPILPEVGEIHVRPQVMHNTLFMARPPIRQGQTQSLGPDYAEAAWAFDVAASEWSWTSMFMDVDLDGWEDLLISTGHRYDAMDMDTQTGMSGLVSDSNWTAELLEFPRLDLPNVAFRNEEGRRFEEMPDGWGIGGTADVTHGMAFGDLDQDGDLDLVTNRLGQAAGVFRNDSGAPRVSVRLNGRRPNTAGIGARITLEGGGMIQEKEILAGGYYLSGSEPVATFAVLGSPMTLTVYWPSGARSTMSVQPNRLYEIDEPASGAVEPADPPAPSIRFRAEQVAVHADPLFEDRERQPLLSRRLSHEGPYVASGDLDGDGRPDLVIGAGSGASPAVLLNAADGLQAAETDAYRPSGQDWGGVAVTQSGELLAGVSGYETDTGSVIRRFRVEDGALQDAGELRIGRGSPGPLAVADIDGDGDQDLFVGVRFMPNRYPESAPSPIFLRDGDAWRRAGDLDAGMVTGAAFADVDGDGDPDLAVSTEWGPVRLYENDGAGNFTEETVAWGLAGADGLWRGLRWADVNLDDRPDLVAVNWGWNSPYGRVGAPDYQGRGIRLYYGDLDRNGSVDPVEAEYAPGIGDWAPTSKLMDLVRGLRYVTRRVRSAHEYAGMSLEEVLGPPFETASRASVTQLAHTVWINTGSGFDPRPLPEAAQWTAASDVTVTDTNGDGLPDLVLSQNFFPVLPEGTTRQDSGNGMILIGDGQGGFQDTGEALGLFGDGRGILAVDLDLDGREEILATQNAAPAYVFRIPRQP